MARAENATRKIEGAAFGPRGMEKNGYAITATVPIFDESEAAELLVGAQLKVTATNKTGDAEGQEVMDYGPPPDEPLEAIVDVKKIDLYPDEIHFRMKFGREVDGALLDKFAYRTHTLRFERLGDASHEAEGDPLNEAV